MDEKTNGHSPRPFGPHGEGCTCDVEETPEQPEEGGEEMLVPVDPSVTSMHEEIFAMIADSQAAGIVETIANCQDEDRALIGIQLAHLISNSMRSFARAKERARAMEHNAMMRAFLEDYRRRQEAGESAEAPVEDVEKVPENELHDVADLFSSDPDGPIPS